MKIYFDCEFEGLYQSARLISIGLVDENNRKFYAEFNDYDVDKQDKWIKENIISNLYFNKYKEIKTKGKNSITLKDSTFNIKKELNKWLEFYGNEEIQFVSDVCHYDFVLLIDLMWDNALNMPSNISPCCIDVNNLIAKKLEITEKEAFNKNREELARHLHNIQNISANEKHNSLFDASIIKLIYEGVF